jgi:hypothetical protein
MPYISYRVVKKIEFPHLERRQYYISQNQSLSDQGFEIRVGFILVAQLLSSSLRFNNIAEIDSIPHPGILSRNKL